MHRPLCRLCSIFHIQTSAQLKDKCSCPIQMLSFMHAQYSLFQQGYNLLDEIDPYMKKLAAEVSEASPSPLGVLLHQSSVTCVIPPSGALSALGSGLSSFELSTGGSCVMHHVKFCFLVDTLLYFRFDLGCIVPNKLPLCTQ